MTHYSIFDGYYFIASSYFGCRCFRNYWLSFNSDLWRNDTFLDEADNLQFNPISFNNFGFDKHNN